jgi:Na+/pantothenate symporter
MIKMSSVGRVLGLGVLTYFAYKVYNNQPMSAEQSGLNLRIQEVGSTIFAKIGSFLTDVNNPAPANDSNLKAFSMVGCLLIITLIAVSIFRQRARPRSPSH